MKPYFAILIDSFNEAVASRMLWILFAAWTLILVGIAPFGFVEERTFKFRPQQIRDLGGLSKQLEAARDGKGTAAQQRIAMLLSTETAETLKTYNSQQDTANREFRRSTMTQLVESLNVLLEKKDLYSSDAWPTADKRSSMKDLIKEGPENLAANELEELNRKLIDNTFSAYINQAAGDGLWLGYAGFKLFDQLPVSRRQANQLIESYAFYWIIKLGLGIVAVFVSIIITSSLIPDTLQIGSLHLLLSKPIGRSLLFLAKFLGGAVFVFLNITYLLVGLYFIAGIRFEIWNEGLLAVIPVVVFVFVIFFSVSAFAGIIWKNAIISVVITILFWLFCFVVGTVHSGFEPFVKKFPAIVNIQEVNGELLASTEAGQLKVWDAEKGDWQGAVSNDFVIGEKIVGPVFIAESNQLVFNRTSRPDFMFRGARGGLVAVDISLEEKDPEKKKKRDFRWDGEASAKLPDGTRQVVSWQGTMLVLADTGLFRFDPKRILLEANTPTSLFGFAIPKMNVGTPFDRVSPEGWTHERPEYLAVEPEGANVWCYHKGNLEKLTWKGKNFESELNLKIDGDSSTVGTLAIGRTKGLLIRVNENPRVFDLANPDAVTEIGLSQAETPRQLVYTGKEDKFAVVYQSGRFAIIDAVTLTATEPNFAGQGEATAVSVANDGNLWVAHSARFLSKWDLSMNTELDNKTAPRTTAQWIFDFIVNPIFVVNPKPSSLDDTMGYLLRGEGTWEVATANTDIEESQRKLDPWTPLWTNALFVAVLLGASCIYFARQEF